MRLPSDARLPLHFFVLAAERKDGANGRENFLRHAARLGIRRQLAFRRQARHLSKSEFKRGILQLVCL